MKRLSGSAIYKNCTFEARGETLREVKAMMLEHALKSHGSMIKNMSLRERRVLESKMEKMTEDDNISLV